MSGMALAEWARTHGRYLLAVAAVVLVLMSSVVVYAWRRAFPAVRQPIQFNHALHVEEVGAGCDTCHRYYKTGPASGFPGVEVCGECHEEALGESQEEARLLEYVQNEQEIPWRRLYVAADNVFYSHRRHVVNAQLACEECHGDIASATEPPGRPLKSITMSECVACHEEQGASVDCLTCHR